jgi:hypothetical protein
MNFEKKSYEELSILHNNLKDQLKIIGEVIIKKKSGVYIKEHLIKCELCDITTNKYNYEKHLLTQRHLNNVSGNNIKICTCTLCNITTNKYNYEKHLLTKKHIKKANL